MILIDIKNIHLQINDQILLDHEDMIIKDGCIHVIMGESGSGKTTLLYEISLLSHISDCNYQWNGINISSLDDGQRAEIRRNHIGYILQDLELISEDLSLKDNLECMFALTGQKYDLNKVNEYMKKMKLHVSLDQRVEEMSRGERQRFALVLALIKDVDLIICDEPTSALDKDNTIELMEHLHSIACDYHKMIVIATHDRYVADKADILYRIEDKHLIKDICHDKESNHHELKEKKNINDHFFKIYRKGHRKLSQVMMKIIYMIMIMILCIVPLILDFMLERQQELFDTYASNEVIVVNTKERLPYSRYNPSSDIFDKDVFNMLKEIKHVKSVDYYWEMNGIINDQEVLIIPKKDITDIIISTTTAKSFQKGKIYSTLILENKDYEFDIDIEKYDIKDYPPVDNVDKEVIYIPEETMKKILKEKKIETSSSVSIECDDIENIEDTISEIQRWMSNATITSSGVKYKEQITNLKMLQQFMSVLRIVMIIGITMIAYIIQMIENNSRDKEICNLRINGISKRIFYKLYYYENDTLILLTIFSCFIGYIGAVVIFDLSMSLNIVMMIIIESMFYIILTRIIPLFISVQQIFGKDIANILRNQL